MPFPQKKLASAQQFSYIMYARERTQRRGKSTLDCEKNNLPPALASDNIISYIITIQKDGGVEMKNELFANDVERRTTVFGEIQYKWSNKFHPDNPYFSERVLWYAWQKKDGSYLIGYKLDYKGKIVFVKHGEGNVEDEIPNYCR